MFLTLVFMWEKKITKFQQWCEGKLVILTMMGYSTLYILYLAVCANKLIACFWKEGYVEMGSKKFNKR